MAKISSSSTAEYFAKNLQQVGFSSPTKAVLTTLKEALDNALDACEEAGILPELSVTIKKIGKGSSRSTDLIEITVVDNGPGLELVDLPRVFGEYLASSKFGKGQCSRGQQGIGISAATTWAQLTNASGARVKSKTSRMRKAVSLIIDVDIKGNKGIIKEKESVDWDVEHGLSACFRIDGRVQLNGDGGVLTYLEGTTLVNPHLTLTYRMLDHDEVVIKRVSDEVSKAPPATAPHPHTMKLGEFLTHAHLYGNMSLERFLLTGFSRVTQTSIKDFVKKGLPKGFLRNSLAKTSEKNFKRVFQSIQDTELPSPNTKSVLTVGEEGLSKSIYRLGDVDFFSVVTRKPKICDFKPIVVEVAIARFLNRKSAAESETVQLLRFANRVPLQFDKAACAITRAVESVNWKSYGLMQSKRSLPMGPYVFAVSVTSPFIKFKNASKETIDANEELVDEIRRALMQTGQKLSRHIRRENRAADLERKIQHIEKFGPILVEKLAIISRAGKGRRIKAEAGLKKLLGRDASKAEDALSVAESRLADLKLKEASRLGDLDFDGGGDESQGHTKPDRVKEGALGIHESKSSETGVKSESKTTKKVATKKTTKVGKKAKASKKVKKINEAKKVTGTKSTKKTAKKVKKKVVKKKQIVRKKK